MKSGGIGAIAVFLVFSIANCSDGWAQSGSGNGSQDKSAVENSRPTEVLVVPAQLTDFERYSSKTDEPVVTLGFPPITASLGGNVSLVLTPLALSSFDAPNNLKAMAVQIELSQSTGSSRNSGSAPLHSVVTLLDFDELLRFTSLFKKLAATGMPHPAFSDAKAVIHMASKSGMGLQVTADANARILCVVSIGADSVTVRLDGVTARKLVDALTAVERILDSAEDSKP